MSQVRRIYISEISFKENQLEIQGQNAKIITQVLRLNKGDKVTLMDGKGQVIETSIARIQNKKVCLSKVQVEKKQNIKPSLHISIGALKGEKSSMVLQKLTEIGVDSISFFESQHTVAKLDEKKKSKFETTCIEAIRQSGNPFLPTIHFYKSVESCISAFNDVYKKICLHEKENNAYLVSQMQEEIQSCHVMIGPEGGFSQGEVNMMQEGQYQVVRCAPYVLRAETAALYCASFIRANYTKGWS